MNTNRATLLNRRVLRLNVGFLLAAGPGNIKDMSINITDPVRVADDLVANAVEGTLRLSRAKEGILLQADLTVTVDRECARCLDHFSHAIPVQVEELYAHPHPIPESEFFVGQDAKLDLASLIRAEVLIGLSHRAYCRDDCQGLCVHCGTNLNNNTCTCADDLIDPRMAKLKELLDAGD